LVKVTSDDDNGIDDNHDSHGGDDDGDYSDDDNDNNNGDDDDNDDVDDYNYGSVSINTIIMDLYHNITTIGAIIQEGADVGNDVIIAAGAVVLPGRFINK